MIPLSAQTKLLRFPDIHDNRIVFTYGGDLWLVNAAGGTATRLTAHPGVELFAKFSPDGKWIAFTGQYDGDEQVYVMPADGGEPKQLTFYPARGPLPPRWGYDNQVYGWINDGHYVIYRSLRDARDAGADPPLSRSRRGRPFRAAAHARFRRGDRSRRAETRSCIRRRRATSAPKNATAAARPTSSTSSTSKRTPPSCISEGPRASRDPMWIGKEIYFNSDRDGHFNLYAYDTASGKTRQITQNTTVGRALALHRPPASASSTNSTASCRSWM